MSEGIARGKSVIYPATFFSLFLLPKHKQLASRVTDRGPKGAHMHYHSSHVGWRPSSSLKNNRYPFVVFLRHDSHARVNIHTQLVAKWTWTIFEISVEATYLTLPLIKFATYFFHSFFPHTHSPHLDRE